MRSCPKHGAGTENGKEYNVVDMAYWFHSLPHMRFTLRSIENTMFNYGDKQYMRAIIFWAVLTLVVCLALLIFYLCTSFVFYLWRTKNSEDSEKDKGNGSSKPTKQNRGIAKGWKITIFILALLCGFALLFGFYGVWKVYVGLGVVHNSTRDGVNWFKAIKEDFGEVDPFNAFKFNRLVQNLREEIDSFGLIPDILNKLTDVLESIVKYADKTNEEVIKANIPLYNLSRIDVEWIYQDIESYGNIACEVFVLIVAFLGIVGLLFTCGVYHPYLLAAFTLIAIIAIILNAFLMSLGLSATILVSDLCVDAKPFIKDQLNEWILYQYLVECPLKESPIIGYLENASKFVTNIKDGSGKLFRAIDMLIQTYCKTTDNLVNLGIGLMRNVIDINIPGNMSITCPNSLKRKLTKTLSDFNSEVTSYTQLINTFKSIADCRRINKDLYDALDSICGEINPGLIWIYFYSIVSFVCLMFIVFSSTYAMITTPVKIHKKVVKKFRKKPEK